MPVPILPVSVKESASAFAKRFFTANLTMKDRANLLAIGGAGENGIPLVTEGVGPALGHTFGSLDGLVGLASLALFIPGFIATPIGAGIFAAAILFSAFKAGKYALSALGSLVSFDILGFITNGLAAAIYAITALPVGRLFKEGLTPTINAIRGLAQKAPGGETVGNYILSTSSHLYGPELTRGLSGLPNYLRGKGQAVSDLAKRFSNTATVAVASA